MKKYLLVSVLLAAVAVSCTRTKGVYVDLNSGKEVKLEKDEETGYMVNAETKRPVYLYIDPASEDTFYGRTGKKVNKEIKKTSEGTFIYLGDDDYVYKNGTYKLKVEADGDYKEKDGNYKKKVEEDGDMKVKNGNYKKKVEEDGDVKIKNGDVKVEIEDGKREVKRDD